MVEIDVLYEGALHCQAQHRPSGTKLGTDAPVDNQGRGESFSPTDLVATALGTCMLTTMGIAAKRKGWHIEGMALVVQKQMSSAPPRRIERLPIRFAVPKAVSEKLDPEARKELVHIAETCPVAISLHQNIAIEVQFDW